MINQDDLVAEVTEDLLLTDGENIYDIVEGYERDIFVSSENSAAINNLSFATKLQPCCVDLLMKDEQMKTLCHQEINEGVWHPVFSSENDEET